MGSRWHVFLPLGSYWATTTGQAALKAPGTASRRPSFHWGGTLTIKQRATSRYTGGGSYTDEFSVLYVCSFQCDMVPATWRLRSRQQTNHCLEKGMSPLSFWSQLFLEGAAISLHWRHTACLPAANLSFLFIVSLSDSEKVQSHSISSDPKHRPALIMMAYNH